MSVQYVSLSSVQAARKLVLLGLLAAALGAIALTSATRFGPLGHEVVENAGRVLLLVCIAGRVWCSTYIGGRKVRELITEGPYSTVRNPLYVFSFLGAAGAGAQSGSLVLAAVAVLITWAIFAAVVRKEEAVLTLVHGDAYRAYRARTPRFLPNPLLWRQAAPPQPDRRRVLMTLADSLVFLLAIPAAEGLEWLQTHGWLTVLANLP